jgi:hypothetical protein
MHSRAWPITARYLEPDVMYKILNSLAIRKGHRLPSVLGFWRVLRHVGLGVSVPFLGLLMIG